MNVLINMKMYRHNELIFSKENIEGIQTENAIIYKADGFTHEINLSDESLQFKRLGEDFIFSLEIGQTSKATYELKTVAKIFDIVVKHAAYNKESNNITFEYFLESDDQPIKVEIEVLD